MLGTCVKYCTNASLLGDDGTYGWSPNIRGGVEIVDAYFVSQSGAFSKSHLVNANSAGAVASNVYNILGFDASLNNSIYIDNGKVYPASIALNFIIKS